MAKQSSGQRRTVGRVMHEWKHGELESSRGGKVKRRRQAVAIALSEAGVHQRLGGAKGGGVGNQPRVADIRGATHRGFDETCNPYRRTTFLQRLQADAVVLDLVEAPLEVDTVLGPQTPHQRDALSEARRAMAQRNAERVEFALAIAQTHAKDELAAREHV